VEKEGRVNRPTKDHTLCRTYYRNTWRKREQMKLTVELDEEDVEEAIRLMQRLIESVEKLEDYVEEKQSAE